MNRQRTFLLGVLMSLFFLWLALRNVEWVLLWQSLRHFNGWYVPVMILIVVLDLGCRSLRWNFLLPNGPAKTVGLLFRLESIGLALNNVLPFRLGELGRTYLASEELDLPLLTVLASVFVERILDGLSLLSLFVFLGDWGIDSRWINSLKETARVGLVVGIVALIGLVGFEELLEGNPTLHALIKRHPKVDHFFQQLVLGTRSLRSFKSAALVIVLGLGLWVWDASLIYTTARAFGSDAITMRRAFTVLMASAAAVSVPGVPGYFGAFELAVSKVFHKFGMAKGAAFPCASVLHLTSFLVTTVLGIVFLYSEGHSLGSLQQAIGKKKTDAKAAETVP